MTKRFCNILLYAGGVQALDHAAWAFFQKYERGDDHFWELIRHRVVVEETVEHHLW